MHEKVDFVFILFFSFYFQTLLRFNTRETSKLTISKHLIVMVAIMALINQDNDIFSRVKVL